MSTLHLKTARVFEPLDKPSRYKGIWGGRGSGKSHNRAEALIEDSLYERGLLSVCVREVQKSLKDSAKRLLEAKLEQFRLGEADGFKVYTDRIQTPGDGVVIFQGMQDHTAESIKSLEGFGRAWVEEAQTLSSRSLTLLRPTIRAPKSELWFTWNPRLKIDAVDAMFRGGAPPTGAIVVKANWNDNPWFPKELEQERLDCLNQQSAQYNHIWEGDYTAISEGAFYAQCLAEARNEGRITALAKDPLLTVSAYWDIGLRDACAIWIRQQNGQRLNVISYYEAVGQPLSAHLDWLRKMGFGNAECVLPHDGVRRDGLTAIRYEDHIREAGFSVRTIANQGKGAAMRRVEAARRVFPRVWFNEGPCDAGLNALGWYHERQDEHRNIGLGPEHDWCLAADTQILTPTGWRNVQDIAVHDEVLTPCGTRRILRSGIVRETGEWITIKGIQCTPEHRFFTNRGLVEAGALSQADRLWTRESLGLRILAFLCAALCLGLKTAIISATPEAKRDAADQCSFIGWSMRLCAARFRKAMKFIIETMTHSITTRTTLRPCHALNTAAATSQNPVTPAFAECAGGCSVATRNSARGAARNAGAKTMRALNESAAPAFNLTVEIDECYFVRGSDGAAYLVSNSSHGADAFGLMCVDYEEPRIEQAERQRRYAGAGGWLG